MDRGQSVDSKVEKKLQQTANRIKKKRKAVEQTEGEVEQYEKIRKLLGATEESDGENVEATKKSVCAESETIPTSAPGIEVFRSGRLFHLFDEHTLKLKAFFKSKEITILGRNLEGLSETSFCNILLHRVFENAKLPATSQEVARFVLYLQSVHSDPRLVAACAVFLKRYPSPLLPSHVLLLLANYGAALDTCAPDYGIATESWMGHGNGNGKPFPHLNLSFVASTLVYYAQNQLLEVDQDTASLVGLLTRICLDRHVRFSPLLPVFISLVNILCIQAAQVFGPEQVSKWLHLVAEHPCNQLEVCRLIVQPPICTPEIHQRLVLATLAGLLDSDSLSVSTPLEVCHVKKILSEFRKKKLPLLEVFCMLQLVTATLPSLTAITSIQDFKDITLQLTALESRITQGKDSTDLARIRSAVSKLRSLLTTNATSNYPLGLSPKGKGK